MCVICHKPAGIELPSDETIKKMFSKNPDGAGFAIQGNLTGDRKFGVKFYKGFMTVEEFIKAIHSQGELKDKRVVMHFRIKTHGEKDKYTTHPFKLSHNFKDLRKLEGKGPVLFHNGVFSGLGGKTDPRASDTQDFVIGVAMHYLKNAKTPNNIGLAVAEEIVGSSRVMILYQNPKYQYIKFGNWTKHTDGCEYSNMLWNTTSYSYSGYGYEHNYGSGQYNYSGHYHSLGLSSGLKEKPTASRNIDRFGCNIAEFAWPSKEYQWIRANNRERFEHITKNISNLVSENKEKHYTIVNFPSTDKLKWYLYPSTLDIVSEKMLKNMSEYYTIYNQFMEFQADIDDEVIQFDDENMLNHFTQIAKPINNYEYEFGKKLWFLDVIDGVAYTETGIRENFKTGEVGHKIKYLRDYGTTDKYLIMKMREFEQEDTHDMSGMIANQDYDKEPIFDDDDMEIIDGIASTNDKELKEKIDKYYGLN